MDLTKITTPFGLLDKETQDALKAWPHGHEIYDMDGKWCSVDVPLFNVGFAYRACHAPKKPREFWISKHDGQMATSKRPYYAPEAWIHVREVMEDEA